jgi:serine/threonine protein kinase
MPADLAKVKALFLAVLEVPANERATFLDTACAADTALRQQIEAMLKSHADSGELLPRSPAAMLQDGLAQPDATAAFAPPAEHPPISSNPSNGESNELPFLTPSSRPGYLGQLGHYEVQKVLGKGGFGVVLRAFDERLHRVVAIKVLSPAYAVNGSARKRFIREARAAAAVKNEHVVGIHDVQEDAQPPYLVMEYIDGCSLQDKIDKHGALGLKEILRIGMQIAEGLAAAHKQGLVHRDIKPANIMLENGVERVKITDFGLARAVDDASVTQSGTVAGTPMYMSPEQAEGLPIDPRSDLFSLGTVLYALCTGHPPFRASGTHAVLKRVIEASPRPIREVNTEIPDWLSAIVVKLHAQKPENRFQTAKEVAELLGQRLADVQAGRAINESKARRESEPFELAKIPSSPVPGSSPNTDLVKRSMRRATVWLSCGVLLSLFLLALVIANKWSQRRQDQSSAPVLLAGWGEIIDPAGDCKFEDQDGALKVTVPAGDYDLSPVPGFNLRAPRILDDVDGDFTVQLRVEAQEKTPAQAVSKTGFPFAGAGLLVWHDDHNFLRLIRGYASTVELHWFQNGVLDGVSGLPDADFLQVERKRKQLFIRTSKDGQSWQDVKVPKLDWPSSGRAIGDYRGLRQPLFPPANYVSNVG